MPIPSLLAVSSVHNHLIRVGIRTFADFVVETGDAISAHDFAALVGYSASGIYPYMAHECIADLAAKGALSVSAEEGVANYNKAVTAGITSIMSKMGISTVQSYHSAQIFEAVGFKQEFVDQYFAGTVSRVGGLGVADVQREENQRYDDAVAILNTPAPGSCLPWALPSGVRRAVKNTLSIRRPSTCCNMLAVRAIMRCSRNTAIICIRKGARFACAICSTS